MPHSVLEAIKMGIWDFEPEEPEGSRYRATKALPGTHEKLDVMAQRISQGLPLWHPNDRQTFDEADVFDD